MRRPSRLLYVIESASGGSLNYIGNLTRILDPDKWDVTVVYSRRRDTPPDLHSVLPTYVNCVEVAIPLGIDFRRIPRVVKSIRDMIKSLSPDIIHLHSSMAGAVGRLATLRSATPVLYTPHGFAFYRRDIHWLTRGIYWGIEFLLSRLKPCTLLVGSDIEFKDALVLAGKSRTRLVYTGVAVPPEPLSVPNNGPVTIAGRVTEAKGPFFLLDVIELVQKEEPSVQFRWVGDGELRDEVERKARERRLNLEITGWTSGPNVRQLLIQSTVYVQTSRWEALPLALLEAMALGRPIVVTSISAHMRVIKHDSNGFIAANKHDFARFVVALLRDPVMSSRIGTTAWVTAHSNYSEDAWSRAVENIYQELLMD